MTIVYLLLSLYDYCFYGYFVVIILIIVLPDSTATDLDQHLSNLVGTPPSSQMTHQNILATGNNGTNQTSISSTANGTNGLLVGVARYQANSSNEYNNVHSSQNGPRSLSDSSQTDSPVQDDLLTTNTPNLGSSGGNQNFSGIVVNQSQNSYGNGGSSCNGSIYPVLPASLLYSQLYTAANQSHSFHAHSLQTHSGQNSVHGELQSVMDHITTSGSNRHQQNLMGVTGHTDLSLVGSCGSNIRVGNGGDDNGSNRQVVQSLVQRGQQQGQNDNGNSVWRPY